MDFCASEGDEWDAKFAEFFDSKMEIYEDSVEHKIEYAFLPRSVFFLDQYLRRYYTIFQEYVEQFDQFVQREFDIKGCRKSY